MLLGDPVTRVFIGSGILATRFATSAALESGIVEAFSLTIKRQGSKERATLSSLCS